MISYEYKLICDNEPNVRLDFRNALDSAARTVHFRMERRSNQPGRAMSHNRIYHHVMLNDERPNFTEAELRVHFQRSMKMTLLTAGVGLGLFTLFFGMAAAFNWL